MPRRDTIFRGMFNNQPSSFTTFFRHFINSFRPSKYYQETSSDDFKSIPYLGKVIFLACLVLLAITIIILFAKPSLVNYQQKIMVEVVSSAQIMAIAEDQNITAIAPLQKRSPLVSFTYEGGLFYHKPILCLLVKSYCLFQEPTTIPFGEKTLLPDDFKSDPLTLYTIILILPSLFLLFYLLSFIKYFAIILLVSLITYVITRISSWDLPGSFIINSAFYASPLLIFLDILSMPFFNIYAVPLLIYLVFYSIILKYFYNRYA
ncbi:hypothetical protein HYY69_02810 [Candidatus Woesearchaeota archaeon]|nr:hypothetical protein [Candidatus Woesearchaeota archaeon]